MIFFDDRKFALPPLIRSNFIKIVYNIKIDEMFKIFSKGI